MLRSPLPSVWTTVLGGVLSCLFVLFATPAMADLITVPSDQPTIQAAIDAAVDGDEVRVLPGNYRERINLLGKKIRIYGSIPNPTSTQNDSHLLNMMLIWTYPVMSHHITGTY